MGVEVDTHKVDVLKSTLFMHCVSLIQRAPKSFSQLLHGTPAKILENGHREKPDAFTSEPVHCDQSVGLTIYSKGHRTKHVLAQMRYCA